MTAAESKPFYGDLLPTMVRVLSRGGEVKECTVEGLGQPQHVLLVRWPNYAGIREFSLKHGCHLSSPQWNWNWELHPDDLAACREVLVRCDIKFKKEGKPKGRPATTRVRSSKVDLRQTNIFEVK